MNMRQLRRRTIAMMAFRGLNFWSRYSAANSHSIPDDSDEGDIDRTPGTTSLREFEEDEVERVWKVARVKDNVVVLEAHTAEAAKEAIDKAARQKKAKLYLLDGEPFCYEAA